MPQIGKRGSEAVRGRLLPSLTRHNSDLLRVAQSGCKYIGI